ncbi:MAG: hypothetical protein JWM82_844 [Myxococcales bacterium]|nr:hypothetical protein [Myxococcales bacterium]
MAHDSSKPSNRNWKKPETKPNDDESWKTAPSRETTSDDGHNAELAREHQREENAPGPKKPPAH